MNQKKILNMTRINVGIKPKTLCRQHLLAELRESKRIPNQVKKLIDRGSFKLKNQPKKFKLGTGHVKFFYNKLLYLLKRYEQLYLEAQMRGYNVQDFSDAWENVPKHLMKDWKPTSEDAAIVQERINQRLEDMKRKAEEKRLKKLMKNK